MRVQTIFWCSWYIYLATVYPSSGTYILCYNETCSEIPAIVKRLAGLFLHARYSEKVAIVIVKRYLEIINSFTDIYSR